MTTIVDKGWAVRITPKPPQGAWLTPSGGYQPGRCGRMVWRDYDDALDASHRWDAFNPVIVRIVFRRKSRR